MTSKLQCSFGAVYALLERPRIARRAVGVLLVIHTLLLGYSAYVHSPTLNEPGHLVAGLSYWKFGRFDVYSVNPPLVRMVAALPVTAVGYEEDWSDFYLGPGARPEFGMGEDFVAANREQVFVQIMIARWACIPFSWVGLVVCYLWARDLYGRPSGVLAATIWSFEPNILAHASLITADAAATALGLAACYTFWRWLKNPTWMQAALTGFVLGLAELAKTTLILFYPLWPLMWIVYRLAGKHRALSIQQPGNVVWLREVGMLVLRMLIGLYILNLGYGFEGSFKQLKDFHFVSDLFTGKKSDTAQTPSFPLPAPNSPPTNRFSRNRLGQLPVPFPKNYLLGIDIQQRDFEQYGRPSYLRGEWRDDGWWYYYLYACAVKVPLPLWLLGLFVFVAHLRERFPPRQNVATIEAACLESSAFDSPTADGRQPTATWRDEFILLFPALVIFTVVSSKTGFSEHMRYVLPAFPYFFIFSSQATIFLSLASGKFSAKCLTTAAPAVYKASPSAGAVSLARVRRMTVLSATFVAILGSWLIASSLWIYPHSLSYFNESVGGPLNGRRHLLGSNVDWGQGLRYLKWWSEEKDTKRKLENLCLAYFGLFSPSHVGFKDAGVLESAHHRLKAIAGQRRQRQSENTADTAEGSFEQAPIAVSVNLIHEEGRVAQDGAFGAYKIPTAVRSKLLHLSPAKCIGYSIFVYAPDDKGRL